MQVNGGPITECPICRYSFEGLPQNHQCPECGFEYEETMRVWVGRLSLSFALIPVAVFMALFLLVTVQLWLKQNLGYFRRSAVLWACLFLPILLNVICYFLIIEIVVVAKEGLFFCSGRRKLQFRPWKEVQVKYPFMPLDPTDLGPTLPRFLPVRFLNKAERRELRDEIVRRLDPNHSRSSPNPQRDGDDLTTGP